MKKLLFITYFYLFGIHLMAQDKIYTASQTTFSTGNFKALSIYLHPEASFVLDDENIASGKEAVTSAIQEFLNKNKTVKFSIIHEGSSKDGKKYIVGRYEYSKGAYRILINFKTYNNDYLVDTFDFTKDN